MLAGFRADREGLKVVGGEGRVRGEGLEMYRRREKARCDRSEVGAR